MSLVWFKRTDLRLLDHPAVTAAHTASSSVAHLFCFDPSWWSQSSTMVSECTKMSAMRTRFLIESVADLRDNLRERGSDLIVRIGAPHEVIPEIVKKNSLKSVFSIKDVTYEELSVVKRVKSSIHGITFNEFWGNHIIDPSNAPFDLKHLPEHYTEFRKSVERNANIPNPLNIPKLKPQPFSDDPGDIPEISAFIPNVLSLPHKEEDPEHFLTYRGGEKEAIKRVNHYVWNTNHVKSYKETRNGMLGADFSTKFSPWLSHGCISPRSIVFQIKAYESQRVKNDSTYWVWFELLWRDFFFFVSLKHGSAIFKLGGLIDEPNHKPWTVDEVKFNAWREGQTGYPLVDANMRELKATGFMSNRGRQIVASFLVNDLELDWRMGAEHFEEHLLDHDPCSNWGNWQYIAGVGTDPRKERYFSILKQGKSYDPDAKYIRFWCPEIAHVKKEILLDISGFTPFARQVHAVPLEIYPPPVVPLKFSGKPTSGKLKGKDNRKSKAFDKRNRH